MKTRENYCWLWRNFFFNFFLFTSACLLYIIITIIRGSWHNIIHLNCIFISCSSPLKSENSWLTESFFCMPRWSRGSFHLVATANITPVMSTKILHSPHTEGNTCFSLCFLTLLEYFIVAKSKAEPWWHSFLCCSPYQTRKTLKQQQRDTTVLIRWLKQWIYKLNKLSQVSSVSSENDILVNLCFITQYLKLSNCKEWAFIFIV